ncbi:MAG TPA: MFS transporter [Devosia sp.]|nr:MFS transporter [Devosia sp.]
MTQDFTTLPAVHPNQGQPETPSAGRWFELALLSLAQLMLILDITVVNVALPNLSRDLALHQDMAGWVIAAYGLPFGALMLVGGRAADIFGARRILIVGLLLFSVASLVAGFSANWPALIGSRVAQGIGAALLSPSALASLTLRFIGAERARALAVWGTVGGVGAAFGVLLGGLLTAGPGWRWIFFLNVPVGIAVVLLLLLVVPAVPQPRGHRSTDNLWRAAAALLLRRHIGAGSFVMLAASALLVGGFFLLSFTMQDRLGWAPLPTGLAFLPVAIGTLIGAHLAGHMVMQVGGRAVASLAFGLAALGFGVTALGPQSIPILVGAITVVAFGTGTAFVAATTTAMSHVKSHETGLVAGLVNTFHELGGALGVAVLSVIMMATTGGQQMGFGWSPAFMAAVVAAIGALVVAALLVPSGTPPADAPRFVH